MHFTCNTATAQIVYPPCHYEEPVNSSMPDTEHNGQMDELGGKLED